MLRHQPPLQLRLRQPLQHGRTFEAAPGSRIHSVFFMQWDRDASPIGLALVSILGLHHLDAAVHGQSDALLGECCLAA